MREQFVKSGEWKLTSSKIEKSIEEFNKYHTRKPRWNLEYPLDGYQCFSCGLLDSPYNQQSNILCHYISLFTTS